MSETANPNIGHGHVWKRADGMLARCGGPRICSECRADAMRLKEAAIYKTELDISLLIRAKDEWQSRAQKAEKLTAEIASLRAQLDEARAGTKGCMAGVTGTSVDPERPSCLCVHFDHPVTDSDRERIRNAHNTVVRLASELDEARRKAIEECAVIAEHTWSLGDAVAEGHGGEAAGKSIARHIRALLSESKS